MSEPEYFPEVSHWYRQDPERDDVLDIWVNENTKTKLRLRSVDGPFGVATSQYVVEKRSMDLNEGVPLEWDHVGEPVGAPTSGEKLAYEYAQSHNEYAQENNG